MQNIELALSTVFNYIGDDYEYPKGILEEVDNVMVESSFIRDDFNPTLTIRNPFEGQTPTPVNFMCGTQKELNLWLQNKQDKYPLIWLVYPLTENNEPGQPVYTYPKARLVFAINNDSAKEVQTRIQTTRYVLSQLTEKFKGLMRQSAFTRFLSLDKKSGTSEKFYPNYSAKRDQENQAVSASTDIWDAITFDCTLLYNPKCFRIIIKQP